MCVGPVLLSVVSVDLKQLSAGWLVARRLVLQLERLKLWWQCLWCVLGSLGSLVVMVLTVLLVSISGGRLGLGKQWQLRVVLPLCTDWARRCVLLQSCALRWTVWLVLSLWTRCLTLHLMVPLMKWKEPMPPTLVWALSGVLGFWCIDMPVL